jgi:uncharacterized protein YgbK (DUF1537 family)
MSLLLGAIADDYTGASDLASTLAGNGLRVVQIIGIPATDIALPDVDAVVIALKSRSIAPADAVAQSLAAEAWLRERGARHVLFKICSTFDSTAQGNIGPVTDALAQRAGAMPLVCPAFPRNGRTVYQGHLFVGAQRLDESPLKDHPLTPMRDSSLVRLMQAQSGRPVGLLPLSTMAQGMDATREALDRLREQSCGSVIADAVFESDLELLGRVALDDALSVGASGLGLGLARALASAQSGSADTPMPAALAGATGALILAGSCSAATLAQIAVAEEHMPVLRLDVPALLDGRATIDSAVTWAREQLQHGHALVASSAAPAQVLELQARYGAEKVSALLEGSLAAIAQQLAEQGLSRLIVAGGETSGAVVDRLGIDAFLIGAELAPGVPMLYALGRRHEGLQLALKSGNFGDRDFFMHAAQAG